MPLDELEILFDEDDLDIDAPTNGQLCNVWLFPLRLP